MNPAAEPLADDFSDRPWMAPGAEPLGEPEPAEKKAPRVTWDQGRAWQSGCHALPLFGYWVIPTGLNLLVPILIWRLKAVKEENETLTEQAIESLNFQINVTALATVLSITLVGLALVPVLWIASTVLMIIASVKAYRGEPYRYPWIYRVFTKDPG